MDHKFAFKECGIGDTIHFISHLSYIFKKDEDIYVDFYYPTIEEFKQNPEEYYKFLSDFVNSIAPKNIKIIRGLDGNLLSMKDLFSFYSISNFKFIDLQPLFGENFDNSKVILHTKVRQLNYAYYNEIKEDFYKVLNLGRKEIILVGEKEIEFGKEYTELGEKRVYSIFGDCIKYLNPNKIIDLTVPKLGITIPDLDKLLEDMQLIGNHYNICFGSAGNVSLACCLNKTVSYSVDPSYAWFTSFLDRNNQYFKNSKDDFLHELENFIK